MFNMNPKQMEQMMKKLGMQSEQINAEKIIIKCADKNIVIDNPQVMKIKMGGQETFQIMGEVYEQPTEKFSQKDIDLIMQQSGCSEASAKQALEETGNIAQAIMKLKK